MCARSILILQSIPKVIPGPSFICLDPVGRAFSRKLGVSVRRRGSVSILLSDSRCDSIAPVLGYLVRQLEAPHILDEGLHAQPLDRELRQKPGIGLTHSLNILLLDLPS
jgi:hypothetical protein